MSIPLGIDEQTPISRFGTEKTPATIILKGTLWSVFLISNQVAIREYQGQRKNFDILVSAPVSYFAISNAVTDNNSSIITDKFWLWFIKDNVIHVAEVEPFVDKAPSFVEMSFLPDQEYASSIVADATPGRPLSVILVDHTADFGRRATRVTYSYNALDLTLTLVKSDNLFWNETRLADLSAVYLSAPLLVKFDLISLDVFSPPSLTEDMYEEPEPPGIIKVAKDSTLKIDEFRIYVGEKDLSHYSEFIRALLS